MFDSLYTMTLAVIRRGLIVLCLSPMASAQSVDELSAMTLESLMEIEVTSVSRKEEQLQDTAAAVYVIGAEDIRRSGAADLAEILRIVPGVHVARIDGNTWAISARGFTAEYATKLLVLVDGRTAYDPTFSGVFWHLQNLPIEDIERIEVIRGPGATMWGANAVNGVISITTRNARDTTGGLLVTGFGADTADGTVRFGATLGDNAHYRVFGRQTTRMNSSDAVTDSWNITTGGFRLDWVPSDSDMVTLSGEAYRGVLSNHSNRLKSIWPPAYESIGLESDTGGNAAARWSRALDATSELTAHVYFDRRVEGGSGAKRVDTLDFEFQHLLEVGQRHSVVWGAGHREVADTFDSSLAFSVDPASGRSHLSTVFVQDEITLVEDKVYLTLGSKFERSSFSGGNVQPSVRAVWRPTIRQSVWGAVSRAVRTPNRIERGMRLNVASVPGGRYPGVVSIRGVSEARAEDVVAYEVGYRYQANRQIWVDLALFHNEYRFLSVVESGTPFVESVPEPVHLVFPQFFSNSGEGQIQGLEIATSYNVNPVWSINASYSHLRPNLSSTSGLSSGIESVAGASPRHMSHVGSTISLPRSFDVSANAYLVGGLETDDVPAYTRVDVNLTWRATEDLELGVIGENLLGAHQEFGDVVSPSIEIGRSVRGKFAWSF
jgi:iron complex outermembrane receptor protein